MPISRRHFLRSSTSAVAAGFTAIVSQGEAVAARRVRVGKASAFVVGKPVAFNYSDSDSLAIADRMSGPIQGGLGRAVIVCTSFGYLRFRPARAEENSLRSRGATCALMRTRRR